MAKIARTCDGCGNPLRKADMWEPLDHNKLKKLCKKCFNKWLDGQFDYNAPGQINPYD